MKKVIIGGLIALIIFISIGFSIKLNSLNKDYTYLLSRYTLMEDNMISSQSVNSNYKSLIKSLTKENKDLNILLAKKPQGIEVIKWKTKVVTNTIPIKDYKVEDLWIKGGFSGGMFTYILKQHIFENVRILNNNLVTYIIWDKTIRDYAEKLTGQEKEKYINLSKVYTFDIKTYSSTKKSFYLNLLGGGGIKTGDFKLGTSVQYNNFAGVGIYNCRNKDISVLVGYNILFWR